jgi:hypothetical protein
MNEATMREAEFDRKQTDFEALHDELRRLRAAVYQRPAQAGPTGP